MRCSRSYRGYQLRSRTGVFMGLVPSVDSACCQCRPIYGLHWKVVPPFQHIAYFFSHLHTWISFTQPLIVTSTTTRSSHGSHLGQLMAQILEVNVEFPMHQDFIWFGFVFLLLTKQYLTLGEACIFRLFRKSLVFFWLWTRSFSAHVNWAWFLGSRCLDVCLRLIQF